MKNEILYKNFLEELRKKIPLSAKLTNKLVELLFIEKEAVYRRLRGEVPFTFHEIATISKALGISLDGIIGVEISTNRPFQLKMVEFVHPYEVDYEMIEQLMILLHNTKYAQYSEISEASNVLPHSLFMKFQILSRFHFFKWDYHHNPLNGNKTFKEFHLTDRIMKLQTKHYIEAKNVLHTFYIWDFQIFHYLVNDIHFFKSIRLLEDDDVLFIKEDLIRFLDYIEVLTLTGKFEETGNNVYIYISDVNIESGYSYLEIDNYHVSLIKTFILNTFTSLDEKTFENVKNWIQSLKRVSTMITISGEKQRTSFFQKQREIVGQL